MSRSKSISTFVLLAILVFATLAFAQSDDASDPVMKKLEAIEKRLISLDQKMTTRLAALEKSVQKSGRGGPDPAIESAVLQALGDAHETGHLMADVPALFLVAGVLWFLSPRGGEAA